MLAAFEPWAIPLAALIISVAALAYTVISSHNSASSTYAQQLERRVAMLEAQLLKAIDENKILLGENKGLRDENLDLLQRLFHATGGRRALPE